MAGTDPRDRLGVLAGAAGVSLAALSRMLGRNVAYLQQYVRRGSPRVLPEEDRRRLAAFFGVDEVELGGAPAPPLMRLPRLDVAASAGPGALVDTEVEIGAEAVDAGLGRMLGLRPGRGAIIRVRGDSMEPGLRDGDQILVDTGDSTPGVRGEIFVIRIDGAVMVKRVALHDRALSVSSDNPLAAPLPAGPVEVIGRVVWQMRRLR